MGTLYDLASAHGPSGLSRVEANTLLAYASKPFVDPIVRDPIQRLETIGAGDVEWRNRFTRQFGRTFGLVACHEVANDWFYTICRAHVEEFGLVSAATVLDGIEPVRPPSEDDIRKGWYVSHNLTNEQVREQYGDYSPEHVLDRLVGR